MAGALIERESLRDARDRAIITLGFCGFRRSELVALDVVHLAFEDHGVEVTVPYSKTDKQSIGRVVAIPFGNDARTCPVGATKTWIERSGVRTGPVFRRIDKHACVGRVATGRGDPSGRLSPQSVTLILRRAARLAGLDNAEELTPHSLRRGFATQARKNGGSLECIGRAGGWSLGSRALLGYLAETDRWDQNAAGMLGL